MEGYLNRVILVDYLLCSYNIIPSHEAIEKNRINISSQ